MKLKNLSKLIVGKGLINLMTTDSEWKRNMTIAVKWVIDEISEAEEIAKETGKEKEIEIVIELGAFHNVNKFISEISFK